MWLRALLTSYAVVRKVERIMFDTHYKVSSMKASAFLARRIDKLQAKYNDTIAPYEKAMTEVEKLLSKNEVVDHGHRFRKK